MALVVKDRVKETSTSTGTGSFTLSGAVAGFQTFASTLTNGDTTYYAITDAGTGDFEVGLGTYNSGVLTRDTVFETHNGLAFVDFNAGEKEVFITYPADKAVYLDADGKVAPTTALMDTIKANDGAGSGLNADLLDGLQASDFVLKAGDTVAGDLIISGDLTVNGTTTTVNATNLAIADNMIYMNDGSTVTNPDLGWSGNYNDGTYAHAGFFRDATDGRFKAYDGYTPEPDASPYIDTSHASFSLADIEANTFYGNLTGTATNANKWTTARTITLGGDLTGSVSIDGTANVVLTAAINDDSHFHVISNIDGLQAALDAKADDTTLISAGTGLTGGGSIGVNRTLSLDTAYTDGRYVNVTGDTMSGTLTAPTLKVSNDASDTAAHRLAVYDSGSVSYGMMLWNSNGASGEWSTMIYGPNQSGRRISFGKINNTVFSNHSDVTEIAYFDLDDSTLRLDADAYVGANRVFHDGYHPNADKWTTARTLTLNGDVSGSVAWDGSGNVTLTTTVADDSHNHVISNVDGLQTALDGKLSTSGKAADSNLLDGLDSNRFVYGSNQYATLDGRTNLDGLVKTGHYWASSATNKPSTENGTVMHINHDGGTQYATQLFSSHDGGLNSYIRSKNVGSWNSWQKIWTDSNDGSGSGLDADTLDGQHASAFQPAGSYLTGNQTITLTGDASGSGTTSINVTVADDSHNHVISNVDGLQAALDGKASTSHSHTIANVTGLQAALDGKQAAGSYLTGNQTITLTGDVSGSGTTSIAVTIADDSHNHIIANVDGLQAALDGKLSTTGKAADSNLLDGLDSSAFLRSNADDSFSGLLISTSRNNGISGTYNSTLTDQIWTMGSAYRNAANGSNFGNLYGLAYKHTNNATGGTMAGGHQMVWCQNGTGYAAMGSNIWTSGNVTAYSDIRVKTNLEVIPDAVAKVKALTGYTFDRTDVAYDEDGSPLVPIRQTGVVAQDVLAVLPEAVTGTEETHYSVAYGNLVGLLIEAIKEQQTQIDELKAKVGV